MTRPRSQAGSDFPTYAVAAYVRGGRLGALAAVLAVLHSRGLVEVRRPGSVALTDTPAKGLTGLEWSVKHGISGNVPPRALASRPAVEAALTGLRDECRRQGLVRPWLPVRRLVPARSRSGRLLLTGLRRSHPRPIETAEAPPSADQLGMLVALYGTGALRTILPAFAARSGLLNRRSARDVDGQLDPDAYNTVASYNGLGQ